MTSPYLNYIDVDRDKAKLYNVDITNIFNTLDAIFGTYYVNYFEYWNDLWWVILQSDYNNRNNPQLLNTLYIKNNQGQMIPLGSLAKIEFKNGPEVVTRFNDYLASQIIVNPKPGYTTGDVMTVINDAVKKNLAKGYHVKWFGPAYQEANIGDSSIIALVLGIVMVFLILASLYELWKLPLAIPLS